MVCSEYFVVFDAVRDLWEAVVIYCFLALILEWAGGEFLCAEYIQILPGTIKQVFPFNYLARWLRSPHLPEQILLNPSFVKICRRATLQFVVIKPIMAFLTMWLSLSRSSWRIGWWYTEIVVYNITYTMALYALIYFYMATKYIPTVQAIRPLPKFLAVKLIVFATYWQSLIIGATNPRLSWELVRVGQLCLKSNSPSAMEHSFAVL